MTFEIIQARNVTAHPDQKDELNMEVLFSHLQEFVPFTASRNDCEEHGRELYSRAMFGEFGDIRELVLPPPTEAEQRAHIDALLKQAAAAMAPLEDADKLGIISEAEREQLTAWQRYRVALYRLPQSNGWPAEVTWPEAPQ
ncbi:tail fiber assembly protein [Aeromonas sp. NJAU223]|uniref:tail fiber assembly protein n=1 Tax=Aeromonas sp. NJAU223 TaxID=3115650 RepID=UPI003DA8F6B4